MNYPAASCWVSKNMMRIYPKGVTPEGSSHSFVWISAEGRIRPKPCGGPDRSIRE